MDVVSFAQALTSIGPTSTQSVAISAMGTSATSLTQATAPTIASTTGASTIADLGTIAFVFSEAVTNADVAANYSVTYGGIAGSTVAISALSYNAGTFTTTLTIDLFATQGGTFAVSTVTGGSPIQDASANVLVNGTSNTYTTALVPEHPAVAATVGTWLGVTPDHGWLFNDSSSPAVAAFGGESLTASSSPTFASATVYSGSSILFDAESNDRILAATNGFLNFGVSDSFAFLGHFIFTDPAYSGGDDTDILSKGTAGNDKEQYRLLITRSDGELTWYLDDDNNCYEITIAADHSDTDTWVWAAVNRDTDTAYLVSELGSASISIAGMGTTAKNEKFRLGKAADESAGFQAVYLLVFDGTDAEGGGTGTTIIDKVGIYL